MNWKPSGFVETEHDVHILNRLPGSTFDEVIDDRGGHQVVGVLVDSRKDVAAIGSNNLLRLGKGIDNPHKGRVVIGISEHLHRVA